MPILLNDEEIVELCDKWEEEYEQVQMTDAEWEIKYSSLLARAQLKKVVEYLTPNINVRLDAPYKTTIDLDVWQSLKEEAGL